jgi:hypothetical protein
MSCLGRHQKQKSKNNAVQNIGGLFCENKTMFWLNKKGDKFG